MTFKRSLAVAMVMSLGMVLLSHAAAPVSFDSSKTTAVSEPIVKEEKLRMNMTRSLVKDVTSHEARLSVNPVTKESELNGALESSVFTAEVPFAPSANAVEIPTFPWAERLPDAGQARKTDTGSDLRYLAHTLRDMADRRDLEIEILLHEWAIGRDEELIQCQRTFAQKLRAVAESAEVRARAIENDTAQ